MSFGGTTRANLGELVYKQETTPHLVDAILLWLGRLGSMLFFLLLVITVILNQGFKNIPTLQEKTSEVSGLWRLSLGFSTHLLTAHLGLLPASGNRRRR